MLLTGPMLSSYFIGFPSDDDGDCFSDDSDESGDEDHDHDDNHHDIFSVCGQIRLLRTAE